jgi:hypothetical protein
MNAPAALAALFTSLVAAAEPAFSYEDDELRVEVAQLSGQVVRGLLVQNKTAEPIVLDLCQATFVDWDGSAHPLAPCQNVTLPPGERFAQDLWIAELSSRLSDAPTAADARLYSLVLPLTVRRQMGALKATFRLDAPEPALLAAN